jgi:hypothetical protein
MSLMDAPAYDPAKERRRNITIGLAIFLVLLAGLLAWLYRYWPQERIADRFFTALEQKDFERAYGIWWNDPDWKQHQEKYAKQYPFNEFYRDWGLGGEWGLVKTHKVSSSGNCRPPGTGVVVEVIVNGRVEPARLYIDKNDKTLSYPPC